MVSETIVELTSLNTQEVLDDYTLVQESDDGEQSRCSPKSRLKPLFLSTISAVAVVIVVGIALSSLGLRRAPEAAGREDGKLSGIVGLNSAPMQRRRLIIFRHCVRSVKTKVNGVDASVWTSHELPKWGTPQMWCTEGGHDIMRWIGQKLALDFSVDRDMMKISSDVVMRDVQTGLALMEGIFNPSGAQENSVQSDKIEFDGSVENVLNTEHNGGVASPGCSAPDPELLLKEVQEALETMPFPAGIGLTSSKDFLSRYEAVLRRLEAVIGPGKQTFVNASMPFAAIDRKSNGEVARVTAHGAFEILKLFSMQMTYSWASGHPWVQWLNSSLSQDDYMFWSAWEYFARELKIPRGWKVTAGTKMVQTILAKFKDSSPGGLPPGMTHIFTGHDTTLDLIRASLNLTWTAPPFYIWPDSYVYPGSGPTPTGSSIMFTMDGNNEVQVDFVYPVYDGTSKPLIKVQPVTTFSSLSEMERTAKSISNEYAASKDCWDRVAATM